MKTSILKKHGDKLLFVLALAVLASAFIRLGARSAQTQPTVPSLVFSHWEGAPEKEALLELIKEFEGLHEGIAIVLETRPYEELRNGLFNPTETDSPQSISLGDILSLDPLWVAELLERGIVEIPRIENPIISFINVLYYNVEILKEAGFSRPPKSRGEFIDYTRALTARAFSRQDRFQGLVLGGSSSRGIYDDIYPWIWAAGAELIRDGQPAIGSRPIAESLSFLAALNGEGLIASSAFSTDTKAKLEEFVLGRAAFMIAPASSIGFVRERMGDDAFGVTSVPIPDNYAGKSFFGSAGWTVGVNSASPHKEEALLFADFIAGKASVLSEKAMAVPGNGIPLPSQDPFYSKLWDIAFAAEPSQDFAGLPWAELDAIFREELHALFAEESSPNETAAAIQTRWEAVLGE